jgi:hypothetical protein
MPALSHAQPPRHGFRGVPAGVLTHSTGDLPVPIGRLAHVNSKLPAIYRRIGFKYGLIATLTFVVVFVGIVVVAIYRRTIGRIGRGDGDESDA